MVEIISVRFKDGGKQYYFNPEGQQFQLGDGVIVETSRGTEYGECVQENSMIDEMELKPGQIGLIVNRAPGGVLDDGVKAEIEKHGLNLLGVLPQDEGVYRCDCNGEPSAKLPDDNPVKVALKGIMQSMGL